MKPQEIWDHVREVARKWQPDFPVVHLPLQDRLPQMLSEGAARTVQFSKSAGSLACRWSGVQALGHGVKHLMHRNDEQALPYDNPEDYPPDKFIH